MLNTNDRQHFLPAARMGAFGAPARTGKSRDARIWYRAKTPPEARETKAVKVGWEPGMYRLNAPPSEADPDRIDKVWDLVEPKMTDTVNRLAAVSETKDDHVVLVNYVATAGVRHPNFEKSLNKWRAELGMPALSGDHVHVARLELLGNALPMVRGMRWRVLHSPNDAPRFIVNDLGWCYVGEEGRPGRGLFVPLSSRVALLGWHDPVLAAGFDHRTLRPSWVRWLNAATWEEAPRFITGHPDDARMLNRLGSRMPMPTMQGAFRGSSGHYLFDEF